MSVFTTLLDGLSFTECPRWRDGRLYFSDRYTRRVLAVSIDGTVETYARTTGLPAGLGFLPDGRLLITSMRDRKVLRREHDGCIVEHADLTALAPGELNDMLVDHEGRAWVGNFGFNLFAGAPACSTVLISVAPDGTAAIAADGLGFPNGTVLTPDRRTLIIAETMANRLSAFTVSDGALTDRRTWAAFGNPPASKDVGRILKEATSCPTASASMPRERCGSLTSSTSAFFALPRAARFWMSSRPTACPRSPACWAATTAEHCSPAPHPASTKPKPRRTTAPPSS